MEYVKKSWGIISKCPEQFVPAKQIKIDSGKETKIIRLDTLPFFKSLHTKSRNEDNTNSMEISQEPPSYSTSFLNPAAKIAPSQLPSVEFPSDEFHTLNKLSKNENDTIQIENIDKIDFTRDDQTEINKGSYSKSTSKLIKIFGEIDLLRKFDILRKKCKKCKTKENKDSYVKILAAVEVKLINEYDKLKLKLKDIENMEFQKSSSSSLINLIPENRSEYDVILKTLKLITIVQKELLL